ncbi:glycine--tRNA ligase subunit beta [Loigolactobacillus bifermentans]|uniref:Glycine--tRNA ligase beta subunit n=1 Tax=Loigolactobacillus bifermentans DSM 20003 TaxID=1423726 RepID=A0A0R1GRX0_9LACO|nr:glycine--tRNA ligase subunit beta [Loigolactobacillus bifermentans]KRK34226.1 glycyl-tRNA synthetase subunit beta [Loigolactobacillus bifermentans DSM 20003]QGG59338.1 glycine--tRNA ligase subunit beta [Loigolactobacillus bifermentans]
MAHTFLMEIGLEEMPAHVVTPSRLQLVKRTQEFLKENRLDYTDIVSYATPRRLTVQVNGVADQQTDVKKEVRGPAKRIAQNDAGEWTKAAQGFVRGQGMTTDDITFKEQKGEEYVFLNKFIPGQPAADVLTGMKDVVIAMTFPTNMHWGANDFEYIRPIHWLVALLDDQVVPFKILKIATGRETQGHRFLGQPVTLAQATDYVQALAAQFVIVEPAVRQAKIEAQIKAIATAHDWQVDLDPDLLEEVVNLVEYPTAFSGQFDPKYLEMPDEVLITSMKDHQRYFYARNQAGQLLPIFISVRNGNDQYLENVIAGNEKVLTARLEDAAFFYHEDQKQTIADDVERLKSVTFHDKIGSVYEKMQRVQLIAQAFGKQVHLTDTELADLQRASEIYKFDLVTGMVGEFSELQGIMGEKYALLQGETPAVATAIREHYMPISADGALPATKVGAVLAIADKFDSMMSFFAVGMIPTGSNDPYALRRQAFGIVRILHERKWHFATGKFQQEMKQVLTEHQATFNLDFSKTADELRQFVADRVRQWFGNHQMRYDIVDTVLANRDGDIEKMFEAAQAIDQHKDDANFKENIEALTRVMRLATKADFTADEVVAVNPDLFENDAEQQLYDAVNAVAAEADNRSIAENFTALRNLEPAIDAYFEATMVMVDDTAVRQNRLAQLTQLARLIFQVGDLKQLIVK